jgi:8-oxo-dGTP pyrophosphatase MutT (NUDIX family)
VKDIDLRKLGRLLPAKPGIMGKDEYVNCAVLMPLVHMEKGYHLLFEKRSAGIRQAGEICFPGGKFDPARDENLVDTALREAKEEVGIDGNNIKVIGRLDTYIAALGATVEPVVATLDIKMIDKLVINKIEVEYIFVLPLSFFRNNPCETYKAVLKVHPEVVDNEGKLITLFPSKELGLPEKYQSPWGGYEQKIFVYKTEYGPIWGITARLIKDLLEYVDNL